MLKILKEILLVLKRIEESVGEKENALSDLEKQYREYKFFADDRGKKLLAEAGLLDEYNEFMTECEKILFSDGIIYSPKIELPKPSSKLEEFKNKFNKFFK